MKALVNIEGGLGKNIMFLSLLETLKNKYDELYIISPYFDLFKNSPYVTEAFSVGVPNLYKDLILKEDIEILWKEPYNNSDFIKKKIHVLDAWSRELGIKYNENNIPKIDLDLEIKLSALSIINQIEKPYIVVQFYGGQSPLNLLPKYNPFNEPLKRNYHQAQRLINILRKKYNIINYSLPNEPYLIGANKIQSPYIFYFEIVKQAEFVIGIDSSLQHFASATDTPTFVLWGETRPEHFGWKKHFNLAKPVENSEAYFKPLGKSLSSVHFYEPDEVIEFIKSKGVKI